MNEDLKLTTVKIQNKLYSDFKKDCIDSEFTLQKLTNRAMDLYMNDDEFRERLEDYDKLNEEYKTKKL